MHRDNTVVSQADRWKGVPVAITGADGFIGSHLAEELVKRGARVRALVQYNSFNSWGHLEQLDAQILARIDLVLGDVRDADQMRKFVKDAQVVWHLAALIGIPYSYEAPASYVATNVVGTLNLLQAGLAERVRRFVHVSTSEAYGTARFVPITEDHPLQAQSPYAASKIAADKLVESFRLSFDLPAVTLRPFNTYGPRQSSRAVIPTIVTQLLAGASTLRLGSLAPMRDFTFVKDTVAALIGVADCDQAIGRVVNVGSGKAVSIGDLAPLIMEVVGRSAPVEADPERVRPGPSEVLRLVCDSSLARELFGWAPRYSLKEGLRETVAAIRVSLDRYKPAAYVR